MASHPSLFPPHVLRGWVREQIQLATLAEALPLPAAAGRQHRLDRACSRSDQLWASPRHSPRAGRHGRPCRDRGSRRAREPPPQPGHRPGHQQAH